MFCCRAWRDNILRNRNKDCKYCPCPFLFDSRIEWWQQKVILPSLKQFESLSYGHLRIEWFTAYIFAWHTLSWDFQNCLFYYIFCFIILLSYIIFSNKFCAKINDWNSNESCTCQGAKFIYFHWFHACSILILNIALLATIYLF